MITDAERRTLIALQTCDEGLPLYVRRASLALPSRANASSPGAWRAHAAKYKSQRAVGVLIGKAAMRECAASLKLERLAVRITREAPRLLDDDNAVSCAKSLRDGLADALGVDDGDERVTWLVAQAKAKTPAVLVEVYAIRGERT